jgi:uncharacterized protein (TIGR00369 family)
MTTHPRPAVAAGTFCDRIGIRLTEIDAGRARAELDVTDAVKQPIGILHGGAVVALADTAASVGMLASLPPGRTAVTLELKANFLRPVRGGTVVAVARELHRGNRFAVWEVDVSDQEHRPVAKLLATLRIGDSGSGDP